MYKVIEQLWLQKNNNCQFIICGVQSKIISLFFAYIPVIFQWFIITSLAAVNPPNTVSWLIFHPTKSRQEPLFDLMNIYMCQTNISLCLTRIQDLKLYCSIMQLLVEMYLSLIYSTHIIQHIT